MKPTPILCSPSRLRGGRPCSWRDHSFSVESIRARSEGVGQSIDRKSAATDPAKWVINMKQNGEKRDTKNNREGSFWCFAREQAQPGQQQPTNLIKEMSHGSATGGWREGVPKKSKPKIPPLRPSRAAKHRNWNREDPGGDFPTSLGLLPISKGRRGGSEGLKKAARLG